ncbi:WD40-repeat-containing domain protein [Cantharellus anzutake]|uniref:WD40-repeat-containing domain protein n=1 Tax=Cantharellus anzutake TaxID=1750568 RepID=UPI00190768F7|nr:WD40-repeat-containing domain protein [Cantharellus anzutake]KAF8344156.1 WD40-repeat-containing domain protein [Cantharellus anzutake]
MDHESVFVAPEGVYTLSEEHKPPPVLANLPSTQQVYPTRLSSILVRFPAHKAGGPGLTLGLLGGNKSKEVEKRERGAPINGAEDSMSSSEQGDENSADANDPDRDRDSAPMHSQTPALFSPGPESNINKKKSTRRPKNNIGTTSSSFVTRLQTSGSLSKQLSNKVGDVTFLFCNSAKTFFWTEMGSKAKDPLARITFSAHPTCHAINQSTASHLSVDIVIGFNTGDLIWFDPMSSRYVRLNKGGCITSSPCTAVHWVPHSRSLFMVSHADGSIIVYDKEREDSNFTPKDPNTVLSHADFMYEHGSESSKQGPGDSGPPRSLPDSSLLLDIVVTPGPSGNFSSGNVLGVPTKDKVLKNPISHWKVSRKAIQCFSFSPDMRHVAVGSEDGCLRVIDALSERLLDTYTSYFGSISCVAWSPEGRYILTGGQDDLLTIYAPFEQRVVARCQGHSSFVAGISFDPLRCNSRTYRFASVGEDNKLIFWDFSGGALHRPKVQNGHQARLSLSSTISLGLRRRDTTEASSPQREPLDGHPYFHPAPSRNEVAVLQPVLTKLIDGDLLSGLLFLPTGLFTIGRTGSMKLWSRPLPLKTQRQLRLKEREKERENNHEPITVS